jgi:hypothetical protein
MVLLTTSTSMKSCEELCEECCSLTACDTELCNEMLYKMFGCNCNCCPELEHEEYEDEEYDDDDEEFEFEEIPEEELEVTCEARNREELARCLEVDT